MTKTWNYFRITWMGLSFGVLLIAIAFARTNPDVEIVLLYAMGVLAFPIGLLWMALVSGVLALLHSFWGIVMPSGSPLLITILGLGFVLLGYAQWFAVVPALIKRARKP